MDFYTNVSVWNGKILYRGVSNGRKVKQKLDYSPNLYVPSDRPSKFKSVDGLNLSEVPQGSIKNARDFIKQYKDISNFEIYGNQRYEYAFISDNYPGDINWDIEQINIVYIDIEVGSENGFPDPGDANEPITAITFKHKGAYVALGCDVFKNERADVRYFQCRDEVDLLKTFIDIWSSDYPDIITGWNVKFFDIPYLINRMIRLLGEEFAKRISPWNYFAERSVFIMGREQRSYMPSGIAILDYLELYKKFAPGGNSQESYKLDAICAVELGERKLSYEEYGNLHTLYRDNYPLFIKYNIRDVELVEKLEDKLRLIELALTLAYDSKSNIDDVFAQVRMWDNLIYNYLKKNDVVIPPTKFTGKESAYVGAYVKDPILGMHKWIASFDLNSLYPHLIMQYNISPETLIDPQTWTEPFYKFRQDVTTVDDLLNKTVDMSGLKALGCTMTPNRHFFRITEQGFLPKMMEDMYNDRKVYQKKAKAAKVELEKEIDKEKRTEIEKTVARYNNLQLAKKVCLNSAYGALGNEFFRFFDIRQASAITTAGQLAIRWIERKLNEYLNKLLSTKDQDYIIASDTDSVYISFERLVNETILKKDPNASTLKVIEFLDKVCETKIQPFINQAYAELAEYLNAYDQKMQMKREALADKGIWTAKKRYILNVHNNEGIQYAKPKIKVMGLESIKSSTPNACREKLKDAIQAIINEDEKYIQKFIADFKEQFKTLPVSEIAFPRGVNGLTTYKGQGQNIYGFKTPIHVRGSLVYNHYIKEKNLGKKYPTIKEGEKIKFIYLKEPNPIQSNIIAFSTILPEELDILSYIDYNTQFSKSFVEPLKIILDCIGWKVEKTNSLEDFFK